MDFVRLCNKIVYPVFENTLNKYFEYLFNSYNSKLHLVTLHYGWVSCERTASLGSFVFLGFDFRENILNYDKKSPSCDISYVKFKTTPISKNDLKISVNKLPHCFKEEREFIFYLNLYEDKSNKYVKNKFLNTFLNSFRLTDSYSEYIERMKEIREAKVETLLGEVIF